MANIMLPTKAKALLINAEKASQAYSDNQVVGSIKTSCNQNTKEERRVIEVKLIGDDGTGLGGVDLLIIRADNQVLTGKTGPTGIYKFKGLEAGSYHLSFPELDKDAWLIKNTQTLPETEARCNGTAKWQSASEPAAAREEKHIIKQGECVGKIAEIYGFSPRTIWELEANATLKKQRHDNMYILLKDDAVVIPAKRQKVEKVVAGIKITVQRQGVPEYLRIRFLHCDDTPRRGVPYLLSLSTNQNAPVADILSETNEHGFVNQPVPPSATKAIITLNPGLWSEMYRFDIGHINPIDTVSGWQARLNNLCYDCGAEDDELGPKTQAAIRAFQFAKQLEETGKMDDATKVALLSVTLS